jgi:regulatory protein
MPTLKQKTPQQALAALMRLSSRAEKSSGDARRLMRTWGVATADADKILEQLLAQKFIDDERYASAYVREKLRTGGWGAHKIRAALVAKGVAREIIAAALDRHLDPEAQGERLATRLARKLPSVKGANPWEIRSKLTRYALSLGYDYDTITEEIDKLIKNND